MAGAVLSGDAPGDASHLEGIACRHVCNGSVKETEMNMTLAPQPRLVRSSMAAALALALVSVSVPALAANAPPAMGKAAGQDAQMLKLSDDGFQAMRDVHLARLAIFNGEAQRASTLLAKSSTLLKAARADAPVFTVDVKEGMNGKIVKDDMSVDRMNLVPIDGQIVLTDDFVDKPARKAHIDKANEHLAAGRTQEAHDELRLAEVDASFTRVLMPLDGTARRIADASRLLGEKKFYEANLALKAAEDGLRVDTVTLTEDPKKAAAKAAAAAAPTASGVMQPGK